MFSLFDLHSVSNDTQQSFIVVGGVSYTLSLILLQKEEQRSGEHGSDFKAIIANDLFLKFVDQMLQVKYVIISK